MVATIITTNVSFIVSCLDGQVTFLSSAITSWINLTGGIDATFDKAVCAIESINNKTPLQGVCQ